MPSTRLGIISYATCSFSLWDVNYKVFDNSNCKWTTSKGAKGTRISNLVRDIFGKEGVWSISKRNYRFPLYSIKEAIEDFCTKVFESVRSGSITDEELASKYNVGPKEKKYTYKRRSCVEYGLITRQSTMNSLSRIGIQILNSNYYKKSRIEVLKILSFIHSVGIKALLRNFINNNESLIYDDKEFYDYLLLKGVTKSSIKRIIKAFNESVEYLEIITPERKIDLNDEYIKLIRSDEPIFNKDNLYRIITDIIIKTSEKDGIAVNTPEMIKDILTDIPFISMSGKTFLLRKDSFGELEYYTVSKDLTDKEKKLLDDYVINIQKKVK